MPNTPSRFSSILVSIGVVLVTLVAGTTYSSYQRDLDLMQVEGSDVFTPSLNSILSVLIRVEYDLRDFILSDGAQSELLTKNSNALKIKLIDLKGISDQYATLPGDGSQIFNSLDVLVTDIEANINDGKTISLENELQSGKTMVANIEKYVSATIKSESLAKGNIQESIRKSARNSMALSFLTVLLSILGMAHFIRLNSQNEMMASRNKKLADSSQLANHAKSRLLTMLSHEIRTPMNGVLGLASLSLQQKMPGGQRKLMEQIRGSAMELIAFLEDILDFSSLNDNQSGKEPSLMLTSNVVKILNGRLEPSMARLGKRLHFNNDERLPSILRGDSEKIQQSLFYLLSYVSKNSFESQINVHTTISENNWLWRIDLTANAKTNENWQISALVGDTEEEKFIASDTIETAMARGLIESMGGEIRLVQGNVQKEKYRLLVYMPIQEISPDERLRVAKYPSDSLRIDIAEVMNFVPHLELESHQLNQAQIVLCEPVAQSELRAITDLRRVAGHAQIICVGSTEFEELYDDVYIGPYNGQKNALGDQNEAF